MSTPEWEEFAANDESELTTVYHVTHVPAARRIIEDKKVSARLVTDKSKLNDSRISVSWVSANYWHYGSLYGTVCFEFPWLSLVRDMNIYWVEAMRYPRTTAYRKLLSRKKIDSPLLTPYDPKTGKGPLKHHSGKWFWNGNKTSEFLIAEDLFLKADCTGFDFYQHHRDVCSTFGSGCVERKEQPSIQTTGAKMLAYILGHNRHVLDSQFAPIIAGKRNDRFDMAYDELKSSLTDGDFGGPLRKPFSCLTVTRSALASHAFALSQRTDNLLCLIEDAERFEKALRTIVRQHYEMKDWAPRPAGR